MLVPYEQFGFKSIQDMVRTAMSDRLSILETSSFLCPPLSLHAGSGDIIQAVCNEATMDQMMRAGKHMKSTTRAGGTMDVSTREAKAFRAVMATLDLMPVDQYVTLAEFRILFERANERDNNGYGSLRKSLNMDPISYMLRQCQDRLQFEQTPSELGFTSPYSFELLRESTMPDKLDSRHIRLKRLKSREELMRDAAEHRLQLRSFAHHRHSTSNCSCAAGDHRPQQQ